MAEYLCLDYQTAQKLTIPRLKAYAAENALPLGNLTGVRKDGIIRRIMEAEQDRHHLTSSPIAPKESPKVPRSPRAPKARVTRDFLESLGIGKLKRYVLENRILIPGYTKMKAADKAELVDKILQFTSPGFVVGRSPSPVANRPRSPSPTFVVDRPRSPTFVVDRPRSPVAGPSRSSPTFVVDRPRSPTTSPTNASAFVTATRSPVVAPLPAPVSRKFLESMGIGKLKRYVLENHIPVPGYTKMRIADKSELIDKILYALVPSTTSTPIPVLATPTATATSAADSASKETLLASTFLGIVRRKNRTEIVDLIHPDTAYYQEMVDHPHAFEPRATPVRSDTHAFVLTTKGLLFIDMLKGTRTHYDPPASLANFYDAQSIGNGSTVYFFFGPEGARLRFTLHPDGTVERGQAEDFLQENVTLQTVDGQEFTLPPARHRAKGKTIAGQWLFSHAGDLYAAFDDGIGKFQSDHNWDRSGWMLHSRYDLENYSVVGVVPNGAGANDDETHIPAFLIATKNQELFALDMGHSLLAESLSIQRVIPITRHVLVPGRRAATRFTKSLIRVYGTKGTVFVEIPGMDIHGIDLGLDETSPPTILENTAAISALLPFYDESQTPLHLFVSEGARKESTSAPGVSRVSGVSSVSDVSSIPSLPPRPSAATLTPISERSEEAWKPWPHAFSTTATSTRASGTAAATSAAAFATAPNTFATARSTGTFGASEASKTSSIPVPQRTSIVDFMSAKLHQPTPQEIGLFRKLEKSLPLVGIPHSLDFYHVINNASRWVSSNSKMIIDGKTFRYFEQYMLYQKLLYHGMHELAQQVLDHPQPREFRRLEKTPGMYPPKAGWWKEADKHLRRAIFEKFRQNEALRQDLVQSHPKIVMAFTGRDPFKGMNIIPEEEEAWDPRNWTGENFLGTALMDTRAQLMKEGTKVVTDPSLPFAHPSRTETGPGSLARSTGPAGTPRASHAISDSHATSATGATGASRATGATTFATAASTFATATSDPDSSHLSLVPGIGIRSEPTTSIVKRTDASRAFSTGPKSVTFANSMHENAFISNDTTEASIPGFSNASISEFSDTPKEESTRSEKMSIVLPNSIDASQFDDPSPTVQERIASRATKSLSSDREIRSFIETLSRDDPAIGSGAPAHRTLLAALGLH